MPKDGSNMNLESVVFNGTLINDGTIMLFLLDMNNTK